MRLFTLTKSSSGIPCTLSFKTHSDYSRMLLLALSKNVTAKQLQHVHLNQIELNGFVKIRKENIPNQPISMKISYNQQDLSSNTIYKLEVYNNH